MALFFHKDAHMYAPIVVQFTLNCAVFVNNEINVHITRLVHFMESDMMPLGTICTSKGKQCHTYNCTSKLIMLINNCKWKSWSTCHAFYHSRASNVNR